MTFAHPANSGVAVDINPVAALRRNRDLHGDSVVVRYPGGYDMTYAELDERCARLAAALADGGVAPGDRVAYVGLNSPAYLITMFACFRIGALFVPVNFRLAGPELLAVLQRSGASVLVGEEGHRELVETVRGQTAVRRLLLVDDDPLVPVSAPFPGWEPWSGVMAAATPGSAAVPAHFDDAAILMFTSGTTGLPKGVVLTYGNIWWNSINVESRIDTRRGDVTYAVAPLFHVGALNSFTVRTIVRGGTVVVRRGFDASRFVDDLVEHRVNSLFAVPAMLATLARTPGIFDVELPALRSIVVAGAPVPASLIRLYAEHEILLQQAWGLTETAPFATHLPIEHTLTKVGSAGIAMPHTEVRVVDFESNETLPAGVAGEIVVRGPNVTPGYWEDPEATAAAFDEDGWFHSGDVGYLDADGFLFIVDRLKDMIVSGGENVYPAEVERVLALMPGITDVAVVGAPDEKWGETVVAVVSVDNGSEVTLEEVRQFAGTELARYKLPHLVKMVNRVPRNASGKIDKRLVRRMLDGDGQ